MVACPAIQHRAEIRAVGGSQQKIAALSLQRSSSSIWQLLFRLFLASSDQRVPCLTLLRGLSFAGTR